MVLCFFKSSLSQLEQGTLRYYAAGHSKKPSCKLVDGACGFCTISLQCEPGADAKKQPFANTVGR